MTEEVNIGRLMDFYLNIKLVQLVSLLHNLNNEVWIRANVSTISEAI